MSRQNVGTTERWASGLGGAALTLWGLRRMSLLEHDLRVFKQALESGRLAA